MPVTTIFGRIVILGILFLSAVLQAEGQPVSQYTLLEAGSDTADYEKEGKAMFDIVEKTGRVQHFLFYTRESEECPTTIAPASLKNGVRLVGSMVSGDVLAVKSSKFDPNTSETKIIELKVLDELGVFSNSYREISVTLEFNRTSHRWELKYKNEVVKSAKFLTQGENKIKEVIFGDGSICEESVGGKKVCRSIGTCERKVE